MGTAGGPKAGNKEDLFFGFDTGFIKQNNRNLSHKRFYKGSTGTNHTDVLNTSYTNTSNANFSAVAGEEIVRIPKLGKMKVKYVEYFNNYSNPGSTCCPNLFYYHNSYIEGIGGSTPYTYSIVYKHTGGYTHGNFMYRYEHNSSNTYLTEGGVHSTSRRRHLGNGWYHAWGTFTTQPTTAKLRAYSFLYNYGTTKHRFYVAKVSIVKNDSGDTHKILDPRSMQDPGTSLGGSDVIVDLTKRASLNLNAGGAISYDTDGIPQFDGTNDFATVNPGTFPSSWSQPFSMEMVMQVPSGATWHANVGSGTGIASRGSYAGSWGFLRRGTNKIAFWLRTGNNTYDPETATLNKGQYYHIIGTWNGSSVAKIYTNGVLSATETNSNLGTTLDNTGNIHIGGNSAFGGSNGGYGQLILPVFKIWKKTIGPVEAKQNFRAYKSRFGLS